MKLKSARTVEEFWYVEIKLLSTLENIISSCNQKIQKKATALFGAMTMNIYIFPFWLLWIHMTSQLIVLKGKTFSYQHHWYSFYDQEETHNIISATACLYISSTGNAASWNWTEAPVTCSMHKVFTRRVKNLLSKWAYGY